MHAMNWIFFYSTVIKNVMCTVSHTLLELLILRRRIIIAVWVIHNYYLTHLYFSSPESHRWHLCPCQLSLMRLFQIECKVDFGRKIIIYFGPRNVTLKLYSKNERTITLAFFSFPNRGLWQFPTGSATGHCDWLCHRTDKYHRLYPRHCPQTKVPVNLWRLNKNDD